MKRIITAIAALAISVSFVATSQAAEKKPEGEKKKADPEAAWKKIAGDKESITKEEFGAKAKDKAKADAAFDKKDTDKDGKLTKAEFTAPGKKAK